MLAEIIDLIVRVKREQKPGMSLELLHCPKQRSRLPVDSTT